MANEKKLPLEVTSKGIAAYAWLYKRDTKFAKKGEDGKFKITLVLDKEELGDLTARLNGGGDEVSATEWLEHLKDMHEKAGGDASNSPVKDGDNQLDKKGKPKKDPNKEFFGKVMVNFKTGYPAQLVDTKKNDLPPDVKIYSGDLVKIVYRPFAFDEGVSLRLNAVMLVDKRATAGGAEAFGDEDEGGYVADKAASDAFGNGDGASGSSSDGDY